MKSIADPKRRRQLVERLEALRVDTPRRWGTLTAAEMLCHLADATSVLCRSDVPFKAGFAAPVLKWLALGTPLPTPKGLKTHPQIDPYRNGSRPSDFETDRQRAIDGLLEIADAQPGDLNPHHPIFGSMSEGDWCRWAYDHTNHHLKQFGL
ncbi:MAG: DinB family protein [Deltaproteobacteria bacterium]|nr:DinB family protein [Deltaproteobacteria bacterium]